MTNQKPEDLAIMPMKILEERQSKFLKLYNFYKAQHFSYSTDCREKRRCADLCIKNYKQVEFYDQAINIKMGLTV